MKVDPAVIKDRHKIYFDASHPNYGKAEFIICPVWKRGKLVRCFITTQQQIPLRQFVVETNSDSLSIGSLIGTAQPRFWIQTHCREHKTQSLAVYVPDDAKFLEINCLSTLRLYFGK